MLSRYATRFNCVEINSSFHRRHRPATWARWADSVPDDFQFSAKVPKPITHVMRLADCDELLHAFLEDTRGLGAKLAILLVQLPPKLAFDAVIASRFFATLREATAAKVVCEPRHPSWFEDAPTRLMCEQAISRVAADPAPVTGGSLPGWDPGLSYWRLHGSPQIYRSSYDEQRLGDYARLVSAHPPAWCIFDNTASSAATENALALQAMVSSDQVR